MDSFNLTENRTIHTIQQILPADDGLLLHEMGISASKHLLDENLTFLWAADLFYQHCGYTEAAFTGQFQSLRAFLSSCPDDFENIRSHLHTADQTGSRQCRIICRLPVKDCENRWYQITAAFAGESPEGCSVFYLVYTNIHDLITAQAEQHRLHVEQEDAVRRAEEANLAKSDFLSRMSHDIRTPMNAVLGMTQLALECPGNPRRTTDCLEKIRLSAETLLNLINDVLDISKIESGKLTLVRSSFSVMQLLERLSTIFEAQARTNGVSFRIEISDALSGFYHGDEIKIERILMNILGNAVKYTHRGDSINLTADIQEVPGKPAEVIFRIQDTGIGIAAGLIDKIFDPFERSQASETGYIGSGLGLAIAKSYVTIMEGTITVESVLGEGSLFTVRLPLEKADPSAQEVAAIPKAAKRTDFAPGQQRILLVEDNQLNLEITQCLLETRGCHVETASDGAQGVAKFLESAVGYYTAIIMDIMMPVMDGLEAAARIRSLPRADAAAVPIIAMSANAFLEDIAKSLSAGMNAHLSKPFKIEELMDILQDISYQINGPS